MFMRTVFFLNKLVKIWVLFSFCELDQQAVLLIYSYLRWVEPRPRRVREEREKGESDVCKLKLMEAIYK